jgi:hypothetical protein
MSILSIPSAAVLDRVFPTVGRPTELSSLDRGTGRVSASAVETDLSAGARLEPANPTNEAVPLDQLPPPTASDSSAGPVYSGPSPSSLPAANQDGSRPALWPSIWPPIWQPTWPPEKWLEELRTREHRYPSSQKPFAEALAAQSASSETPLPAA